MTTKSTRPVLKVDDSDLPQLKSAALKDVDDDHILAAADELTVRHGALRSSVTTTPRNETLRKKASPRVLMSLNLPAYLDTDLTLHAAKRRVSKVFLILEALAKSGYEIHQEDLIGDRRRKKIQTD